MLFKDIKVIVLDLDDDGVANILEQVRGGINESATTASHQSSK